MQDEYLKRVQVYLQQELPEYREMIVIKNGCLVFTVHPGAAFEPFYKKVQETVTACIARIRNREFDLEFKVWSPTQERDFKIYRPVATQ